MSHARDGARAGRDHCWATAPRRRGSRSDGCAAPPRRAPRSRRRERGRLMRTAYRRYGFIAPEGGGPAVFVHVHAVEAAGMKMLVAGQLVACEVGPAGDGRSKAVNLR